jgi:hypothetical protein
VPVATFTDPGGAELGADYAASILWGDGGSSTGALSGPDGSGRFTVTGSHTYNLPGTETFQVTISHETAPSVMVSGTATVSNNASTTSLTASANPAAFGQALTFTATIKSNAGASLTPTGSVDFFDTTTATDLGSVTLVNGSATLTTSALPVGANAIKASYSGDSYYLQSSATLTVTVNQSIIVLDGSAKGALTLSGSATIKMAGNVIVDSNSSSALQISGATTITAASIKVVGNVSKTGSPTISPAPVTGAAVVADPLAAIDGSTGPSTTGLTNYGAVSVGSNTTRTLSPGIYSQISISTGASVTLNPGLYIIEGGGFSVSGPARVTGSGVTIYNAGSSYPSAGGTYGAISISGSGTCNLTPPATGTYAGVVIDQPKANTQALALSGPAAAGLTGAVIAPGAALSLGGSAQLNVALIVDSLSISGAAVANALTLTAPDGTVAYTPAQIRSAYGINSLSLDGTGQSIALVEAYDNPSIYQAVDLFDTQFGLTDTGPTLYQQYGPATSFVTVLNQSGQPTGLPPTDPTGPGFANWEGEEALDVEWAHAIAPGAQIVVVEANSQTLADLMASVATASAQPGVSVVSMSWGFPEGTAVLAQDEATYDSNFTAPGVAYVASTGDFGAADAEYPAFSSSVLAVGGTTLQLDGSLSYNSETGWGNFDTSLGTFIGSGGGISKFQSEPAFQLRVQSTGARTIPDVSFVADPATGAWIADPYNLTDGNPFEAVGGTSLSAPSWAGLVALADQGRAAAGKAPLNSANPTELHQALYGLSQNDYNIIFGGNNGYRAGPGYNLVTGLGTPMASRLVPDLVAYDGPGNGNAGGAVQTVAAIQSDGLEYSGQDSTSSGGAALVFNVFNFEVLGRPTARPAPVLAHMVQDGVHPVAAGTGTVTAGHLAMSRLSAPAPLTFQSLPALNQPADTLLTWGTSDPSAPMLPWSIGQSPLAAARQAVQSNLVRGILDGTSAVLVSGALPVQFEPDPRDLIGSAGQDVLIGGEGEDLVIGSRGRDCLIGGFGPETTRTESRLGILATDSTGRDPHAAALGAVMAEWGANLDDVAASDGFLEYASLFFTCPTAVSEKSSAASDERWGWWGGEQD